MDTDDKSLVDLLGPETPIDVQMVTSSPNLPAFWDHMPQMWFCQIEAMFAVRAIKSSTMQYFHVVSVLPAHIVEKVTDLLLKPPEVRPYEALKAAILERCLPSEDARLRTLLHDATLGDRKPSELLRQMQHLAGSTQMGDSFLRDLWLQRLPKQTQAILRATCEDDLSKLARVADNVHEALQPTQPCPSCSSGHFDAEMNALTARFNKLSEEVRYPRGTPRRSQSRRRTQRTQSRSRHTDGYCHIHRKYGDEARNCWPPCSYPRKARPTMRSGNYHPSA